MLKANQHYIRSAVFGFEDALVSTTGVIIGILTGTSNKDIVLLAAFVTVAVEAVSMAAGQFLSERTLHEIDKSHKDNLNVGAVVMFASYLAGGIIPISPILFLPHVNIISIIIAAFSGLFVLGFIKGKVVKTSPMRSALEMLLIGGVAAAIGMAAGYFLKI